MNRLKKFLGYTLACISLPIVLATFIGMNFFSETLAKATGVVVSPQFTGGNVINTISHDKYNTLIHRSVFDGLLEEKKNGFVQLEWTPLDKLPSQVKEDIDFDGDGNKDFNVEFDSSTCKAAITSYNPKVTKLEGCYKFKNSIAIRVSITK